MYPVLTSHDAINRTKGNIKFLSQLLLLTSFASKYLSDITHLVIGQCGHRVLLSTKRPLGMLLKPLTSFVNHVNGIIPSGAKPKMGWVYAKMHVTSVTNVHARGNRPIMQFVRETVRQQILAVVRYGSIAMRSWPSCPHPAVGCLCDMLPEINFGRLPIDSAIVTSAKSMVRRYSLFASTPTEMSASSRMFLHSLNLLTGLGRAAPPAATTARGHSLARL